MYLKRVELIGFKSFADKTKIEFNDSITGIVGPNGSGKSNISDAIMWVLGEQSVRSLRGNKMEDVIFSGTSKRKPLGYAEVTIVFDNTSKRLPVNFSEVSISRKMFRSGESQFSINKSPCRLKDVRELFMDTGIGKDGYSIIGQGKVESILSNKPEDRRSIFEEAAGIIKYKSRKQESERNLSKTNANLVRLEDIISEITLQEENLKIESEKASKYLELVENLKKLEVNLYIHEKTIIDEKIKLIKNSDIKIEDSLTSNLKMLSNLEDRNKELNSNLSEIETKLDTLQESKLNKSKEYEKKLSNIDLQKERVNNINNSIKENSQVIQELEKSIEVDNENITSLTQNKESLETRLQTDVNTLEERKEILLKKSELLKEEEFFKSQKDREQFKIFESISSVNSQINTLSSMTEEKKERFTQITNRLEKSIKNNDEVDATILEIQNGKSNLEFKINENRESIKKLAENRDGIRTEIEKNNKIFQSIEVELKSEITKYNLLHSMRDNYEGYSKSVKSFLVGAKKRALFKEEILGTVAELIKTDKYFEVAISVALGGSSQNIIVQNANSTKPMINFIKENKFGRVTFLPLDNIKGSKINYNKQLDAEFNILGLASDLVRYPKELNNIILFLLGRTLIVKDMDGGLSLSQKLSHKYRIVTLDGQSLNAGGSITGGSVSKSNSTILSRDSEIEELRILIEDKQSHREKLNIILQEDSKKIVSIEETLGQKEEQERTLKNSMEKTLLKSEVLRNSKETISDHIQRYKEELIDLKNSIDNDDEKLRELYESKSELEKESKKQDIERNVSNSTLDSVKKEIEQSNNDITNLKIVIREKETKIENISDNIKRLDTEVSVKRENLKSTNKKLIRDQDNIIVIRENIKTLKNDSDDLKVELDEISEDIRGFVLKKTKNRDDYEILLSDINKLNKKITQLEKQISSNSVNLDRLQEQLENIWIRLSDKYGLKYEEALVLYDRTLETRTLSDNIISLNESLEKLGTVNITSIDEYVKIKERLSFNIGQRRDLIESREKIEKIIIDLEGEMKKTFKESFYKIAENFNEIFQMLFNGGKATLEIENEKDLLSSGIEINVQPPGKRLQSLSLLSGGEKSLTAVALLFSILKQRPAPFCILDEIDAALDDANIKRYIEYLRSIDDIQFIIITHRKTTMEIANVLYGVTMEEQGVSNLISLELNAV